MSYRGFEKEFPGKIDFIGSLPRITLVGNYKINGQMLVLPIQGNFVKYRIAMKFKLIETFLLTFLYIGQGFSNITLGEFMTIL